jgi:uncharacterized protein (DUF4415 family)
MKPTPTKTIPGMVSYRREPGTPLNKQEQAELEKLAQRPEDVEARRAGELYRPVKKAVSLRLDADVIAWLKKDGKGQPGESAVAGADAKGYG